MGCRRISATMAAYALTPSGQKLLVVNPADNRLMIFDTSGVSPALIALVPVGLDPVSVRAGVSSNNLDSEAFGLELGKAAWPV